MAQKMAQKQITIVVAAIKNEQGELLLTKRRQPELPEIHGKWEFPGGNIEFGEDPIQALKREVLEEIGIEVKIIRLLPKIINETQKFKNGNELQILFVTYECEIVSGIPKPTDDEIETVVFFRLEEVKNLDAFKNIYETIGFFDILNP